ncbi:MAG TPA: Crp/Fnr family transcriptional regulator, partial [Flavobacterium sp.]|nr:Crp/Fnr family transcriptional regulator [Flavobacterium sp.]
FIGYFNEIMPLTDEEMEAIVLTTTIKNFKKGTVLLEEGQVATEAYFVLEGCVRQYFLIEGEEKTNNFFTEKQWVVSLRSMGQMVPSDHFLDCSTDCTLVVGNREKENGLYDKFPRLESVAKKILENTFAEQQDIMANYIKDTPEQRYLKLLKTRPDLFQLIPQYQIASYIGIKPESLSRIRRRLTEK